jgi:phosphoserine phosphatase RsbU/P
MSIGKWVTILAMLAPNAELSAAQVLAVLHRDEPYLFLGAAFATVGIVSAALCVVRKKFDALLVYFAVFAFLYGQRLWLQSGLLQLLVPHSPFFLDLRAAINFVVPIPAVLFFNAAGLVGRWGKVIAYAFAITGLLLALAAFIFGPLPLLYTINNTVVIIALVGLCAELMTRGAASRDFVIIRRGLFIFVAFALWDNIAGFSGRLSLRIEPLGFVAFLASLGYVAARRTIERDQQLGEIQKELEVARRIQQSILPAKFPDSASFRVAARYVPMTSVAGDFYDFIVADDRQAGLLIADVSGHGVPAALIASMVKLAASSQRPHAANPSNLLSGMNVALCGNTQNQFVTAAYVHLDSEAKQIRYSAAGHPPMLLLRGNQITRVEENGLMLAAFDFATYSTAALPLQQGDRLLLYTDGILEAANDSGEFFGQDALCAVLKQTAPLEASDAADRIISSVRQWAASQDDDLTLLVCDYVGNGASSTG